MTNYEGRATRFCVIIKAHYINEQHYERCREVVYEAKIVTNDSHYFGEWVFGKGLNDEVDRFEVDSKEEAQGVAIKYNKLAALGVRANLIQLVKAHRLLQGTP